MQHALCIVGLGAICSCDVGTTRARVRAAQIILCLGVSIDAGMSSIAHFVRMFFYAT